MEKIIQYTTSIIIVFTFLGCTFSNNNKSFDLINEIEGVRDSIISFKKKYDQDFYIYHIEERGNYKIITFELPNKPYSLANDYEYRKIEDVDLLYIDYNKKININENHSKLKELISKGKIIIVEQGNYTDNWYLKFVYCKKDLTNVISYDKNMFDKEIIKNYEKGIKMKNEDTLLFPNCN